MTEVWYRLNTMGEKKLFSQKSLIDGAIVPAHLLAFYDGTLPLFLQDLGLPFFIDPLTYVWAKSPNYVKNGADLKKSYAKYVDKLNCNLANELGKNNLAVTGCSDSDLLEFTKKIIFFQQMLGGEQNNPRAKSLERIRKKVRKPEQTTSPNIGPRYLVPPYFQIPNVIGTEYDLSLKAARMATMIPSVDETKIMPLLHLNQSVVYEKILRDKIISDFSDFKQVTIWINNFDERIVSKASLLAFIKLIDGFKGEGVDVINLFGCYFSVLMSYHDLTAFSSGIALTHRKNADVQPSGGGSPLRYYEPTMKMEVVNTEAFRLYSNHPSLFRCDCPVCAPISSRINQLTTKHDIETLLDPFFLVEKNSTGKTTRNAIMNWSETRAHFLHQRKKELNEILSSNIGDIVSKLKNDYAYLISNLDFNLYTNINNVEHLKNWFELLE